MRDYHYRVIVLLLVVAAAGIAPAALPAGARAAESRTAVYVLDDARLGGEPGEDPHLKIRPQTKSIQASDPSGGAASTKVGEAGVCATQAESTRDERGEGCGSRVMLAWRVILLTWLWHLQR